MAQWVKGLSFKHKDRAQTPSIHLNPYSHMNL